MKQTQVNTENSYEKQAIDFLEQTGTVFFAKYLKTDKYFPDDKEQRDIYECELIKGGRSYKFTFGQSINCSGEFILLDARLKAKFNRNFASKQEIEKLRLSLTDKRNVKANKNYSIPTAYDVLTSLTKYDPGTFENFCSEFGYDTDSRKAEKTYEAVKVEYYNVSRLFTESELEKIREIE